MTRPSADELTAFQARVIVDAIVDTSADQAEKRADEWVSCLHRSGIDYPGRLSVDEHMARDAQRAAIALAMRRRAHLLRQRRVRL